MGFLGVLCSGITLSRSCFTLSGNSISFRPSAEPVSNDVLIITNSGGHGVLTTDAIDKEGLNEIELPERGKQNEKHASEL